MKWKIKKYLEANSKTLYALGNAMDGKPRGNLSMLYRIRDGQPVRVNVQNVERIITGLEKLGLKPSILDIIQEDK